MSQARLFEMQWKLLLPLLIVAALILSPSCATPAAPPEEIPEHAPAANRPASDITTNSRTPGPPSTTPERSEESVAEQGPVYLTAAPAQPDDLAHIYPLGLMSGAHVTPVDHQYYYWKELDVPLDMYPVFSPADGYVINVQFLRDDYIVFIEHSANVQTEYIHLEKLVGPLAEIDGTVSWGQSSRLRMPVRAGEVFALDGGTNGFDFSVHDYSVTLPGFINPQSYVAEPWKVHSVDPYDYFVEPVRSQLLARNVRQVAPLGGKLDYDIPGRLIGNWFVAGTNGYAGVVSTSGPIAPDQQTGYWNTHLAIAPDPIDPGAIIVSMGLFEGATAQLAVKDIGVYPQDVSVETGLVKYELTDWYYVFGEPAEPWHGVTRRAEKDIRVELGSQLRGVVLFQLIDEGHLKMEAFPRRAPDDVGGFTENAKVYER
ncbi:hypothetical protein ACFLW1_00885 [Chloroflexota bacterium]